MDEPTAALSAVEVDRLFGVVETLRASGAAVLFISHRLEEVFALCQRVTVFRDGRLVLTRELAELTPDDLVRAMVGRELPERVPQEQNIGEVVLQVERLTREGVFVDVSFEVRAGEIVALAGPRRRRTERGRTRRLRDRPLRRRARRDRRQAAASGISHPRDGRRDRPRARGPPPAGPRDGDVDRRGTSRWRRFGGCVVPASSVRRASAASRATGRPASRSSTEDSATR